MTYCVTCGRTVIVSRDGRCPGCREVVGDAPVEAAKTVMVAGEQNGADGFWRNTWQAWRSGALAVCSNSYQKVASISYTEFRKGPDCSNQCINRFLEQLRFDDEEFLIACKEQDHDHPAFVLSSKRAWFYDVTQSQSIAFDLSQIVSFTFLVGWATTAVLRLQDNSEHVFKKLAAVPKDEIFRVAIERSKSSGGWKTDFKMLATDSSTIVPDTETAKQSGPIIATKEEEAAGYSVTVTRLSGEAHEFVGKQAKVSADLRHAVLAGEFAGDANALVKWKGDNGNWLQEEKNVREVHGLASIYHPVRHRVLRGLIIGALIGVSWEFCYQSWVLYERYQNIGITVLFWIPVAFFVGLTLFENAVARLTLPVILLAIFMGKGGVMKQGLEGIVGVMVPTFGALFVSGVLGSLLGLTGGGALAGIWAISNRAKLPVAGYAKAEPLKFYSALVALLFLLFIGISITYVTWARHWPVRVESSLRADLSKEMQNRP